MLPGTLHKRLMMLKWIAFLLLFILVSVRLISLHPDRMAKFRILSIRLLPFTLISTMGRFQLLRISCINPFRPLARSRFKSFLLTFPDIARVVLDIRSIEKYGRRADPNSVVFRILAAVERLLQEPVCQAEPGCAQITT